MPISLGKTLQGTAYTLYIVTELAYVSSGIVVTRMSMYQSVGHRSDGFFPIVARIDSIVDSATVNAVNAIYQGNYNGAVAIVEAYLVANVSYYSGGTVV